MLHVVFLKGAKSIISFEILPEPPNARSRDNPWPQYPRVFKLDYGHEEVKLKFGKDPRLFCILSKVCFFHTVFNICIDSELYKLLNKSFIAVMFVI